MSHTHTYAICYLVFEMTVSSLNSLNMVWWCAVQQSFGAMMPPLTSPLRELGKKMARIPVVYHFCTFYSPGVLPQVGDVGNHSL